VPQEARESNDLAKKITSDYKEQHPKGYCDTSDEGSVTSADRNFIADEEENSGNTKKKQKKKQKKKKKKNTKNTKNTKKNMKPRGDNEQEDEVTEVQYRS
jgi:hypothetical protein